MIDNSLKSTILKLLKRVGVRHGWTVEDFVYWFRMNHINADRIAVQEVLNVLVAKKRAETALFRGIDVVHYFGFGCSYPFKHNGDHSNARYFDLCDDAQQNYEISEQRRQNLLRLLNALETEKTNDR